MKLAVFDIDGTLTDSHGFDAHFFAAVARVAGVSPEGLSLHGWTHVTDEAIAYELLEQHGHTPTPVVIDGIKAEYEAALRAHMRDVAPMPGAKAMLARLRAASDWQLAIATGNWGIAGVLKLAAGGVDVEGIPLVGCDERPSRTELMAHALHLSCEIHGVFDHVVYIGDAHWDVGAARALGWNFVGLNADREKLLALGATHVLADYTDQDAAIAALLAAGVPR